MTEATPLAEGTTDSPSGAERVAHALREAIVRCELSPGDVLSEAEVSRHYGVSRQPVREAFIRLAQARLVEVRPKSGTLVCPIDEEIIHGARLVREAVEVELLRRIAATGPLGQRARPLQKLIAAQEVASENPTRFLALDEAFHRTLAELAGGADAYAMIDTVKAQMDRVRYLSMEDFHCRRLIGQHRAVTDALARGDGDTAIAVMREHLTEILRSVRLIAERHPALFQRDRNPRSGPLRRSRRTQREDTT
ncbi:GntR family transcriptional regulator [Acuticoccus mangrovi]|uniref:GntR family transcriptional regulator n=1 Tax=Acuticoccus mangrovi TaxID=2796142 RepID=A0A934MLD9_9HYPH|nr:GntR family transcriptional regulator [Acuticoccus mangrovi]MBJ3776279.1 GntR family transcriptional regulator [Acuticoccus mangrovi]